MRAAPVRISHIILFLIGSISLLSLGTLFLARFTPQVVGFDEFSINYTASKNWITQGRNPYDPLNGVQVSNQQAIGIEDKENGLVIYFRYPLLTTGVILPFTLLPMAVAKTAWMVFSILCLVTGSLLMMSLKDKAIDTWVLAVIALFSVLNFYSVMALEAGNLFPQLFFVCMLVLVLLQARQDVLAGFMGTCVLLFPQYGILLAIFLNIWAIKAKRRKFLNGFYAGLIFEVVISLIILPTWIQGWLTSIVQDISQNGTYSSMLSQLIRISHPNTFWLNLILHLCLLLILVASSSSYSKKNMEGLAWKVSLCLIITSLVVFPVLPGVQIFCMPGIIMIICSWMTRQGSSGRPFLWGSVILLLLIPWVMCLFIGSTVFFIIHAVFYAVFAMMGLYWIRWWMIRPQY